MIQKDRKILEKWALIAYNEATKEGFKGGVFLDKLVDILMKPEFCFTTLHVDKKHAVRVIKEYLFELQEIIELVNKGKFSSSLFRHSFPATIYW